MLPKVDEIIEEEEVVQVRQEFESEKVDALNGDKVDASSEKNASIHLKKGDISVSYGDI